MILTIIVHGRNDGYHHNFLWRIQTAINRMGQNAGSMPAEMRESTEIVLMDWGSTHDRKLADSIDFNAPCRERLRTLYVDPDTVRSVAPDAIYSSSHAVNAAVRRSRGKHILVCDSDVYWTEGTTALLVDAIVTGRFWNDAAGHELDKHFFWSARRHIPKPFNMTCPSAEVIDAHIATNGHAYELDKPDPHDFAGATCALFATREMWFAIRGLNETLVQWGFNDLCIHERLKMLYGYGGDVDDYGLKFYHLEHYNNRNVAGENNKPPNVYSRPGAPVVNGDNWGLLEQPVHDSLYPGNT